VDIDRFHSIARRFANLRIAVVGDFCLDRYLEIDPARQEISIETGLPVHNVVNVRSQPGGAGTVLNNLVALGIGQVVPVGLFGKDGEGFELQRALSAKPKVQMDHLIETEFRRTFTYTKPLLVSQGKSPVELNRLDFKNWTPTPALVQGKIVEIVMALAADLDAMILLDQVDMPETGVLTSKVLKSIQTIAGTRPDLLILADSRRSLRNYPPVTFKMNRAELSALTGANSSLGLEDLKQVALALSQENRRKVFVTLSEQGIIGAAPDHEVEHVPALPVRGEIDIVGAGDSVTANLAAALAGGASLREALEIANTAASIVIHQLGTTGTATIADIQKLA
jgi:rfaE bifunctional protein kinase chain/domain